MRPPAEEIADTKVQGSGDEVRVAVGGGAGDAIAVGGLRNGNGLKARCLRGGAALAAGSVFERGLRFVTNMILARLLAPEQFGLMALVLAANGLVETVTEIGTHQAVVQNKNGDSAGFVNMAWWFSGVRGLLIYVAGLIAAPWIAGFYGEPMLVPLLRVAFLSMLFYGLKNPQLYVLEKHLKFGRYVAVVQGSALAGTVSTLGMVMWVPNVWALVIGFVMTPAVRCILSFMFCPVRLGLSFDRQAWKELFRFSQGMAGLGILTYLFKQGDIFLLGKLCDKELLGFYSMALLLASMPQMLFTRIAGPIVLPVLADSAESKERLRSRLLRMTQMLFLFGLPVATCMAVFSQSILEVIYGPRYVQVSGAFSWLLFYTVVYVSGMLVFSVYVAVGRPELHRRFVIIRIILLLVILYPAIHWFGATGAAGAKLVCVAIGSAFQIKNMGRLIELPMRAYFAAMRRGVVLAAVILLPALGMRTICDSAGVQCGAALSLCCAAWGYILWADRRGLWQSD